MTPSLERRRSEAHRSRQSPFGPWLIRSAVLALCLGAIYLYQVRGTALLMDLAALGGMFCF
jgi:hypothetical protein